MRNHNSDNMLTAAGIRASLNRRWTIRDMRAGYRLNPETAARNVEAERETQDEMIHDAGDANVANPGVRA